MKYKDSGVDIDIATETLKRARRSIASTWGDAVASDVGSFGGLFAQPDGSYLVSSIDGVGTKVLVALSAGQVGGVGADLVNHCVNDILVQGADPLFFLDYFATGALEPEVFESVVGGMADACRENGCALIGGETAEMPGLYGKGHFDLAGCIVGRVDRDKLITGANVKPGMALYAWPSTGLHTNGYSLARRALIDDDNALALDKDPGGLGTTLANALLAVHRSYLGPVRALREHAEIAALCHITGGGLLDNLPRVLPESCSVSIEASSWEVPPLFGLIARRGDVDVDEMRRVFNLGIGMVAIMDELAPATLAQLAEPPLRIGSVESARADRVRFLGSHRGL